MPNRLLILCIGLSVALSACGGGKNPAVPSSGSGTTASQTSVATKEQLEERANAGDANAQFELGAVYHDGEVGPKDFALAKQWFEKAAKQGEIRSQFNLGVMYYQGEGVPQNYAKAKDWFGKAATQGNARAQFNLGVMNYRGEGMSKNFAKAIDLFNKAAAQNFAEAQFNLGVMYALGEGVTADGLQAYAWFTLAKAGGNTRAAEAITSLEEQMTPEQIKQARDMAVTLGAQLEAAARKVIQ